MAILNRTRTTDKGHSHYFVEENVNKNSNSSPAYIRRNILQKCKRIQYLIYMYLYLEIAITAAALLSFKYKDDLLLSSVKKYPSLPSGEGVYWLSPSPPEKILHIFH